MKLTSIFALSLFILALVACGKPSAPVSAGEAFGEGYGSTHEGQPAEGRNALPE